MFAAIASAWTLLFGIALLMLGNGLQVSLLGIRATQENFAETATGLVMSAYYLGFLAGSLLAPKVVRNVGHVRVFAALASLASTAVLVHAIFIEPATWAAMRLVTGFCYAGLYVVAESWLNDRATNETRGQLLSIYMVVVLSGMAGGQLLLNLAAPSGFELFVLASVLVSIALIPISLTAGAAPAFAAARPVGLVELFRLSPLGVFGAVGTGLAHGILFGMGAVFAERAGLSVGQISIFMSVMILGGILLQWPIGGLSDRFDRRRVMTIVTFAAAIFAVLAVIMINSGWMAGLFVTAVLVGGLSLPMYSLAIAHTNDYLEPGQMVAAGGTLVLASGLGACLGPLTASLAMQILGPNGFFWCLAAAHGTIGVFALYRMSRRAAKPLDEQMPSVAVGRASPLAVGLAMKTVRDQMDRDVARLSR
jgi:MFS family permease